MEGSGQRKGSGRREEGEGRQAGRKEGRMEGRMEGRKEGARRKDGRKEGWMAVKEASERREHKMDSAYQPTRLVKLEGGSRSRSHI